jgi:hypothetical protein
MALVLGVGAHVEQPIAHDEALTELVVDLLGRAPRCRLALSGKAHEQLRIQRVSLATTRQRASEQRDLARMRPFRWNSPLRGCVPLCNLDQV